jgi:hypothetical protein
LETVLDLFEILETECFVELCAGTASVSHNIMGIDKYISPPYLGWKYRYAPGIIDVIGSGKIIHPKKYLWVDPGPWGLVWPVLIDPVKRLKARVRLSNIFSDLGDYDSDYDRRGKELFLSYRDQSVSQDPIIFASDFLFLQSRNWHGRAVWMSDDKWKIDAYTNTILSDGKIKLRGIESSLFSFDLMNKFEKEEIEVECKSALQIDPIPGSICYIDPPYRNTQKYCNQDLNRLQVIDLADKWKNIASVVAISEAEPLLELEGWEYINLTGYGARGTAGSLNMKHRNECLTIWRNE